MASTDAMFRYERSNEIREMNLLIVQRRTRNLKFKSRNSDSSLQADETVGNHSLTATSVRKV